MVRKKVPEWLNNTMWSTPLLPSFNDEGLLRHSPAAKISSMKEDSESITVASRLNSAPPPSTASSVPSPPSPRRRNGSSISGEYGNSGVPSSEDFSRQAHLLAELSKKVINMKELRSLALQSLSASLGIRSTV